MPKISYKDADNYNTGGNGGGFFQLKKDKEKKHVRFMLENMDDLDNYTYVVHSCKVPDKEYGLDVNCLREYDDPVDACPLCAAGIKKSIKVYVPLFNEDDEKVQIWSRGKKMIPKLQGLMSRYEDFPGHIFEIERNGKSGSTDTTYEIYEQDEDDTTLDDLDELPTIEGVAVKNYSEEDMEYYLESGEFPPEDDDDDEDDVPVRRKSKSKSKSKRHRDEDDDEDKDVKPRRRHRDEPEDEDDDDEDEEEERPVRKKSSKSKKRRHRNEDDF